jgi:hypothetical protein
MTQRDIDRAVARATGETVGRVHQMGFTLVVFPPRPVPCRCSGACTRPSVKPRLSGRPFVARQAARA